MPVLHLDFETRSAADLKKVGSHRYAEDPSTEIILASYRFDDGPMKRWLGETPPAEVVNHVCTGGIMAGHNQQFERVIWRARIGPGLLPDQQDCTMSRAAASGLPHSLDNLGAALDLSMKKDKEGHALMLRMCRAGYVPKEGELERLATYCDRDVDTETEADRHLPGLTPRERRVWILDQRINDRGFAVELPLVQAAHGAVVEAQKRADTEMWRITNGAVAKVSQTARLADWINARGIACTSIAKAEVPELIVWADMVDDADVVRALRLRRAAAGAFKFEAMLRAVCSDGRIKGCILYHGTHGGRFSGRVVQPHNFKRIDNDEEEAQVAIMLDLLRTYGKRSAALLDAAEMLLDMPVLEVLTLCARPMIVARPGHRLVDADFSNIEGRLNAWFAGEAWKIEAFEAYDRGEGPDIYRVTAGNVLGKPTEEVDGGAPKGPERQMSGKVPELACGYQGGANAFHKMAAQQGMPPVANSHAARIVRDWRDANPMIVSFWAELQEAAINAVKSPGLIVPVRGGRVKYLKPEGQDFLWCLLPSGRVISYAKPKLGWSTKYFSDDGKMVPPDDVEDMPPDAQAELNEVNTYGLTYWGQKNGRWMKLDLYGGMQCAHVVSGTARDLLVEAMFAVEAAGYPIILTVHDEIVAEVPADFGSVDDFKAIIARAHPAWLDGLPVAISAWEDSRYVK